MWSRTAAARTGYVKEVAVVTSRNLTVREVLADFAGAQRTLSPSLRLGRLTANYGNTSGGGGTFSTRFEFSPSGLTDRTPIIVT